MEMYLKLTILLAFLFVGNADLFAQKVKIFGKVIDKETGEDLIGAYIVLKVGEEQKTGTSTDIDGTYSLETEPGIYEIVVSYISYNDLIIKDVNIKEGENFPLDISLSSSTEILTEVVVTAEAIKNTDAALITLQRKSFSVQDGISSKQISRTGSSNAAEAMKQMTGAVIEDGRFVVMRGLGDRYSLAQLNGVTLPSADPYKNSSSLDIIPAQMIDHLITNKTFTPDMPGNFSGGLVNITTKTFPEQFTLFFSLGLDVNTQSTFQKNFLGMNRGKYDWLGFDDGGRAHPELLLDPKVRDLMSSSAYLSARNPSSQNDQIRNLFDQTSKVLSNEFIPTPRTAPMNRSFNFSIGNKSSLFGKDLGYSFGLNYSNNYTFYGDGVIATYINTNSSSLFDYQKLQEKKSVENPHLGAIANISYKLNDQNIISVSSIFNNDADMTTRSQTGRFLGQVSQSESSFNTNTLEFTQRQFLNTQISGKHGVGKNQVTSIEWMISNASSLQKEPDLRYFAYTISEPGTDNQQFYINNSEIAFPYHFFRDLKDKHTEGKLDIAIPFLTKGNPGSSNKLKVGAFFSSSDRNFEEYRYQLNNSGVPSELNFSAFNGNFKDFLSPSNFGIIGKTTVNGVLTRYLTGYHYINQNNDLNFYTGSQDIFAAYGMLIQNITKKLKFVGGGRLEATDLNVKSRDLQAREGVIDLVDLLYSTNLIYEWNSKTNVRLAASNTLARPNMRELAPFYQFDTKNGFFNIGNPDLRRTLIQNYDFRYETYPNSGELFAVSLFAKTFVDPILRAFNPRATIPELSYINVDNAQVFGFEMELRKNLGFLNPILKNFLFSSNLAIISSGYDIPAVEVANSKAIDPRYSLTRRPFQGQAPFITNFILSYLSAEKGFEATASFNLSGRKLYGIALFATPDIYEEPIPLLNFKISKRIGDHYQISFTARNLLNAENRKTQNFNDISYLAEGFRIGSTFGINFTYLVK
jgi:hypothetical protein